MPEIRGTRVGQGSIEKNNAPILWEEVGRKKTKKMLWCQKGEKEGRRRRPRVLVRRERGAEKKGGLGAIGTK